MKDDPQKPPKPWYQAQYVCTTDDVTMSEEDRRIIDAYYAQIARKGLERLRRGAS
jgi:hypothetical protein